MSESSKDGLLDYSAMTDEQLDDHLQSIEAELSLIKSEQANRRNANKGEEHVMELAKLKERREKLNAIDYKSLDQAGLTRYMREVVSLADHEQLAEEANQVKIEAPVIDDPMSPKNMRLVQLAAMEALKHIG